MEIILNLQILANIYTNTKIGSVDRIQGPDEHHEFPTWQTERVTTPFTANTHGLTLNWASNAIDILAFS